MKTLLIFISLLFLFSCGKKEYWVQLRRIYPDRTEVVTEWTYTEPSYGECIREKCLDLKKFKQQSSGDYYSCFVGSRY